MPRLLPSEPELRQASERGRIKLACPRGKGARATAKAAKIDWYLNDRQLLLSKPAGTMQPQVYTDDRRLKLKSNRSVDLPIISAAPHTGSQIRL